MLVAQPDFGLPYQVEAGMSRETRESSLEAHNTPNYRSMSN